MSQPPPRENKKAPPRKPKPGTGTNAKRVMLDKIAGEAARYCKYRDDNKACEAGMKKLSDPLKEAAEAMGEENASGSFMLALSNGYKVGKIKKTVSKIDQEAAVELLKNHKDKSLLHRCTKEIIDPKEIERLIEEGYLGIDEVESITKDTVSFSIKVDAPKK